MTHHSHAAQHEYDRLFERMQALEQKTVQAFRECLLALRRNDPFGAERLIAADDDLDALTHDVEELAIRLIAIWQPMARDLRRLIAVLAVASELERIGDYAGQVAGHVRRARAAGYTIPHHDLLLELGAHAQQILETAITAFLTENVAAARTLAALDNEVDLRKDALVARVHADAAAGTLAFVEGHAALDIARVFERTADRATNIAERTIYLATAAHESLNP